MKKNIAVVAGGDSSEWVVSVKSAEQVCKILDAGKYNIFTVIIRENYWVVKTGDNQDFPVDKNDFSFTGQNGKIKFDTAVIMIHGTPGEDGKLQGYFELINVPYTTCDVLTSAITFNKSYTKTLLAGYGILSPRSFLITKGNKINTGQIIETTGLPCFVKPNRGGSSFGVSKIKSADALEEAIQTAFIEDEEVLVEQYIHGTELTCGLLKTDRQEYIFPLTEVVSKNEFFDYEAKYTTGMADEITPARISPELEKECSQLSSFIYDTLNCKGIVRIDYIRDNNHLYFLEVNTVPGMTENSIVPQQIRAMGLTEREIFTALIENCNK